MVVKQPNTLEVDTQITRDLGNPYFFPFLVLSFLAFRICKFAFPLRLVTAGFCLVSGKLLLSQKQIRSYLNLDGVRVAFLDPELLLEGYNAWETGLFLLKL